MLVGLLHIDLHECTGIVFRFPRRRFLASTQSDDHIAQPNRLPRFQGDVAAVAGPFVEDAEYRDPVLHRRCTAIGVVLPIDIDRHDIACARCMIECRFVGIRHDRGKGRFVFLAIPGKAPEPDARSRQQGHDDAAAGQQPFSTHASGFHAS
ncbi:hypothetical protein GCM10023219_06730 [Stakelama sediminis]|uniref:Uncharacterized protein n=1 Tax=Stakelama sediminis TaxID=463200 RepID=A0A840YUS6_9SPHN|nr:hypothetical protein [Stakelama sediminis]